MEEQTITTIADLQHMTIAELKSSRVKIGECLGIDVFESTALPPGEAVIISGNYKVILTGIGE